MIILRVTLFLISILLLLSSIVFCMLTLISDNKDFTKVITPQKEHKKSLAQQFLIQPWLSIIALILTVFLESISMRTVNDIILVIAIAISICGIREYKIRTKSIKRRTKRC